MIIRFLRNRFFQVGWQDRYQNQGRGNSEGAGQGQGSCNANKPISGLGVNCVCRDYDTKMIHE